MSRRIGCMVEEACLGVGDVLVMVMVMVVVMVNGAEVTISYTDSYIYM